MLTRDHCDRRAVDVAAEDRKVRLGELVSRNGGERSKGRSIHALHEMRDARHSDVWLIDTSRKPRNLFKSFRLRAKSLRRRSHAENQRSDFCSDWALRTARIQAR